MPILPANKLCNIRRRADRALYHTCAASRHLLMMADALASKRTYHMFTEDPEHCAVTMYSVVESLGKARKKLARNNSAKSC